MKCKKKLLLSLGMVLVLAAAFLHSSLHWKVIGWANGEAFYQGLPTSYWRRECQQYSVHWYQNGELVGWRYQRNPSWSVQLLGYFGGTTASTPDPLLTDPLLREDLTAIPVLVELLQSGERQSQLVAAYALKWIGIRAGAPGLPVEEVQRALQDAIPALQEAARSDDKDVRKDVLSALWTIDPKAAKRTEDALADNGR